MTYEEALEVIENTPCIIGVGAPSAGTGYKRGWIQIGHYPRRGRRAGYHIGAHVAAFMVTWGSVPKGMVVMHTCDNPPCVNPLHLRLGTQAQNMADMWAKGRGHNGHAAKTHCPQGHVYDEANTRLDKNGGRYCRACQRERARVRRSQR
jgi:hypothetical protein